MKVTFLLEENDKANATANQNESKVLAFGSFFPRTIALDVCTMQKVARGYRILSNKRLHGIDTFPATAAHTKVHPPKFRLPEALRMKTASQRRQLIEKASRNKS